MMFVLIGLFGWCMNVIGTATTPSYDLPALPTRESIIQAVDKLNEPIFATALALSTNNASSGIPKILWTTMKVLPSGLNPFNLSPREQLFEHPGMAQTCERNPTWTYNMVDDERVDRFFDTVFANTSVLWAFRMINPSLGAARADLFRYAVLYCFGGVYFDTDVVVGKLDQYLTSHDKFIWATEGNPMRDCYQPSYPLSKISSTSFAKKDRILTQWMLLSAPFHPITARVLTNAVEVIRRLYLQQEVLLPTIITPPEGKPVMALICATGPLMFSVSVRQVLSEYRGNNSAVLGIRYAGKDYKELGAKHFKAANRRQVDAAHHYTTEMNQHGIKLLTSYAAASPANATTLSTRSLLSTSIVSTSSPVSNPHPPLSSGPHLPPRWLINHPPAFHHRQVHGVLNNIQNDSQAMNTFHSLVQQQLDRIDASTANADGEVVDALEHFFWGMTGGIALELGALDGTSTTHSMTYEYEKTLGWKRILIDANPSYRTPLVEHNPTAFSVHAAICTKKTQVHYVEAKYIGGILEFMGTSFLTKFYPKLYRAMIPPGNISSLNLDIHSEVVLVECIPLAQILSKAHVTHVNYFILDVEGGEWEVLKSIHWHHVKFDVLCIETDPDHRPPGYAATISSFLASKGYIQATTQQGRNTWFIHKEFKPSSKPGLHRRCYNGIRKAESVRQGGFVLFEPCPIVLHRGNPVGGKKIS